MAMLATLILFAGMAFSFLNAQTITPEMSVHVRAARDAEQRNDFSAAVHEYQILATQMPRNAEVQSNLGVAEYFNHQFRKAIASCHKAIALNPQLMAPHLFAGLAWYRLSNPDAAVPELEKAVRLKPSDVTAHTWLGYAYSAQSRDEAAVKEFEVASRLDPNNVDVWYSLGHTWLQIGQAITLKLLAIMPDGARVWELAGEQCLLRGDEKMALHDFEQANTRRPDIAEVRDMVRKLGGVPKERTAKQRVSSQDKMEDELYQKAREAERNSRASFEHVIDLAPDSYRAHQIMADADVAEKQYDKAIGEYRAVLSLKPDLPGIHNALGEVLFQTGKVSEALNEFKAELEVQPNSATASMNAGRALLFLGQDEAAAKMLHHALRMDRPPPVTYVLLGKVDVMHHDYRGAVIALKHYTATTKTNSSAYYLLAMAYRGLGDKEKRDNALKLFKETSREVMAHSAAQRELLPPADRAQIVNER